MSTVIDRVGTAGRDVDKDGKASCVMNSVEVAVLTGVIKQRMNVFRHTVNIVMAD